MNIFCSSLYKNDTLSKSMRSISMKQKIVISVVSILLVAGVYFLSSLESKPPSVEVAPVVKIEPQVENSVDNLELIEEGYPQKKKEIRESSGENTLVVSLDNVLTLINESGKEKIIRKNVSQVKWSSDGSVFTVDGVFILGDVRDGDFRTSIHKSDGTLITEIPGHSLGIVPSSNGDYVAYASVRDDKGIGFFDGWTHEIALYSAETDSMQTLAPCVRSCFPVGVDDSGVVYFNDDLDPNSGGTAFYTVSPTMEKKEISRDDFFRYGFYGALHTQDFSKVYLNDVNNNQLYIYTYHNGMDPQIEVEDGVSSIRWSVPSEILEIEHIDENGATTIEYRNI